jgi:hypothetical protein
MRPCRRFENLAQQNQILRPKNAHTIIALDCRTRTANRQKAAAVRSAAVTPRPHPAAASSASRGCGRNLAPPRQSLAKRRHGNDSLTKSAQPNIIG